MDQNQQRELIQNKAEELSKNHKHLLITWATGCGKGRAVMQCIAASSSYTKWLIVVPEILQIENYKKDLEKHGFDYLLGTKIHEVICYASLPKYEGTEFNLALNECHYLSDEKLRIAKSIAFDQIVSDSATVSSYVKARLRDLCSFHEYHISLDDAIDMGILPEPVINVIPVKLDKVHIDIAVKKTFGKKVVNSKMSQYAYAKMMDKDIEYWKEQAKEKNWPQWILNKINQLSLHRKKFLAECKTKAAKQLLEQLAGKRLICFTGSVNQADDLCKERAVHSKKSEKHNKDILKRFNNYEIDSIFANKMMREGMNLDGLQAGIIIQLDSGKNDNGLSFFQMTGRSMRAVSPQIYLMYAKDTNDEKYLKTALSNIDEKYVAYGKEIKWED